MKLLSCLNNTSCRPKRVLCVSKLSSLEFIRSRYPNLNENQILSKMKRRGKDVEKILTDHELQIACEQKLASVLKKLNISFRITKKILDATKCVHWSDLVIPIGGDGTFLLASKLITDNTKPVFGINPSVPTRSNIFTLPAKYSTDIENIFEKLHSGEYTLLMRSRIRTVMNGEGLYKRPFHIHEKSRGHGERRAEALIRSSQRKMADTLQPRQRVLPWLALNEVFMGEFLAARPIWLSVEVEGQPTYTFRSSGICVCTGSGSQSWYTSINVHSTDTIERIVEIAMGKKLKPEESNELLYKYQQTLLYQPDDLRMVYIIRDMYHNISHTELDDYPERQICNKITVTSRGFDAGLIIDGSLSLPFNDGTFASFEIKPEYSLKTIVLT